MARKLPIIHPTDVLVYTLGKISYVSVVLSVLSIDHNGYVNLEIYDLVTPDLVTFPPATREDPIEISLSTLINTLTVYSYDEYAQLFPEHLL